MTDENVADTPTGPDPEQTTAADVHDAHDAQGATVQYGVGPVTIRELAIVVAWLAAFIISFFPLGSGTALRASGIDFINASVWTNGLAWILTIGVPTVAVFLIVLRRFSPEGIRRVGSLAIDQFASVAMSVAAVVWLQTLWETVAVVIGGGPWLRGWVVWVELALMIALVVLTVFAPLIPPLNEDFQHRPEVAAHRNARPVRRVVPAPRRERPVRETPEAPHQAPATDVYAPVSGRADASGAGAHGTGAYGTGAYGTGGFGIDAYGTDAYGTDAYGTDAYGTGTPDAAASDAGAPAARRSGDAYVEEVRDEYAAVDGDPVEASYTEVEIVEEEAVTPDPQPARVVQQAFWALAPVERDVYDERGVPIFRIGPTAWALVIEDRGDVFVVRHDDGRIGYLHDVSDITRG